MTNGLLRSAVNCCWRSHTAHSSSFLLQGNGEFFRGSWLLIWFLFIVLQDLFNASHANCGQLLPDCCATNHIMYSVFGTLILIEKKTTTLNSCLQYMIPFSLDNPSNFILLNFCTVNTAMKAHRAKFVYYLFYLQTIICYKHSNIVHIWKVNGWIQNSMPV